MGLFSKEFKNVIEWQETQDDVIFWKWHNDEIKKGSRLVIRPGQDAIFLYNGKIEGIFTEEGNYEVESQIIPFLSTLKGFSFGFQASLRAEVLFVNTKEFLVKWGTPQAVNIPYASLPGGLPIRAFGTCQLKVSDYVKLIDEIAGVKDSYRIADVRERILSWMDQLLMKWILQEGKDLFHLQSNAAQIAKGLETDLDYELMKIGFTVSGMQISSFNYPQEIQQKVQEAAGFHMVGDMNRYQQGKFAESLGKGGNASGAMEAGFGMAAAMGMMGQMMQSQNGAVPSQAQPAAQMSCTSCGKAITAGDKFCSNCGTALQQSVFCTECGQKIPADAKFCPSCGKAR